MTEKDIIELQNIYTTAAQNAKKNNKFEYKLEMKENVFIELFKKAFPNMKDNMNTVNIAKSILRG